MRKSIYIPDLNTDIDRFLPNLIGKSLVVYHDFYDVQTQLEKVEWSKYKVMYFNYEVENLIVVGLNRMRTAEARCDLVFSYMYRMNNYQFKAVVDDRPFNGEPWRLWYHGGFLYGKFLDVDYSYPIETEWKHWFYYENNDCKVKSDNLNLYLSEIYTELIPLTTRFEFYEPNELDIDFYDETKKIVFKQFDTPKMLINNLLKHCNKHFGLDIDFESYRSCKLYNLPNFGVYRYLAEENMRRLDIYNCFTKNTIE